jgi:RimJ/RimL family protein N-acetyltransferase
MIQLETNQHPIIKDLFTHSSQELSIQSVIHNTMPGKIYVNSIIHPTSVFIQTSECYLLAGDSTNLQFNNDVKEVLDFWDSISLDTEQWEARIPEFHKNKFLRKYKRRHYVLKQLKYDDYKRNLKDGFFLEKVDPVHISNCNLKNSNQVMEWVNNWGSFENYNQNGFGYIIRNEDTIVSWSLTDCTFENRAAIGIHCDAKYRKNGFGAIVAAATCNDALNNGFKEIDWLCVDTNRGSIAIAEKLGFERQDDYYAFASYPPIENERDLTPMEWEEWAVYYEKAIKEEPRLFWDCALCFMKANNIDSLINLLNKRIETGWKWTVEELANYFPRLKNNVKWEAYLHHLKTIWI